MDKSPKLTEAQNKLCYEIKFALMRAIINLSHDKIYELVREAEQEARRNEKKHKGRKKQSHISVQS